MNWLHEIEAYKEAMLEDIKAIIAIPSLRSEAETNAPFGKACREALDYIVTLGNNVGFDTLDIDGYAGVISYGTGKESVGVLTHLDVVPVGEGWTKDPFTATLENNYLFGRGVLDDKGPGIAAFYALKMLKDHHVKLSKKIMLIYGCDEESGMSCMDYYVKHAEIPSLGFTPDADFPVIYGEKGGLNIKLKGSCNTIIHSMHAGERCNIVIGRASCIVDTWNADAERYFDFYLQTNGLTGSINQRGTQTELSIEGAFAHAAMPYLGDNAALHLLNFIGTYYHDEFAKKSYDLLWDWMGSSVGILYESPEMGFLTMNTGVMNIENGSADFDIDIRYPIGVNADHIMSMMQNKIKELHYPLVAILDKNANPLYVDPKSELVTTLRDMYYEYTKDTSEIKTIGGGTYAKKFPNFVAFGPEFPMRKHPETMFIGGPHQRDEAILIDDLLKAAAIYAGALEKLAK